MQTNDAPPAGVDNFWLSHPSDEWSDAIVAAMKLGGIDHLFFVSGTEINFFQEAIAKAQARVAVHVEKFRMAREGKRVLDGIGDHHHMANGAAARDGVDGRADIIGRIQHVAQDDDLRARRQRVRRREFGWNMIAATRFLDQRFSQPVDNVARGDGARETRRANALSAAHKQICGGEAKRQRAILL